MFRRNTQPEKLEKDFKEDSDGEEIIDVSEFEKYRDKFYRARVKRKVDGAWLSGIVQNIEMEATTKEKLYMLRYDDGDLEHLTLPEVSACKVIPKDGKKGKGSWQA